MCGSLCFLYSLYCADQRVLNSYQFILYRSAGSDQLHSFVNYRRPFYGLITIRHVIMTRHKNTEQITPSYKMDLN